MANVKMPIKILFLRGNLLISRNLTLTDAVKEMVLHKLNEFVRSMAHHVREHIRNYVYIGQAHIVLFEEINDSNFIEDACVGHYESVYNLTVHPFAAALYVECNCIIFFEPYQ